MTAGQDAGSLPTSRSSEPSRTPPEPARVLAAVNAVLVDFLAEKRTVLAAMDRALLPVAEELAALCGHGAHPRSSFAYWSWRGFVGPGPRRGTDLRAEDAVFCAVAALDLLDVGVRVHQDLAGLRAVRHGRPATHRGFASQHRSDELTGDGVAFGNGSAILVGDLALVWSDELLNRSGLSTEALGRVTLGWDTLRTESTAARYLDLLRGVGAPALPPEDGDHGCQNAGSGLRRALELGAALAGAGPSATEICARIGLPLDEAVRLRREIGSVVEPTLARDWPAPGPGRGPALVALAEDRITAQTDHARRAIATAPWTADARAALDALTVSATSPTPSAAEWTPASTG